MLMVTITVQAKMDIWFMALWMKSVLKKSTKKNNPLTTKAAPHRQKIVYGAPLLFLSNHIAQIP